MDKLAELKKILSGFSAAMMTTLDSQRHLVSRPMATQKKELPDADLWFVASFDSDQTRQLQLDPRVNLAYFHESGDRSYASVSGTARLDNDRQRIKQLWDESWRPWFPQGQEDPNLCLILVDALQAQYWKPDGGKLGAMWSYAKAYVTGEHPEINPPVEVGSFTKS